MTNLLFNLTIAPLQLIYEILYEGLHALTHNYGWALILLSFVTTLITVPLGKAVSNHIKKERLVESILEPQIKKIKASSTGAVQSKRIRNLYQRYAYNPLYSIRLAFGVLIQLPFLIGAYWMIAEHPSLSGVSFGPITDLSQPDRLLGSVNLLPLIMTAANLGVVVISSQMPKRDRMQAVVIAILFLVLLYSAPSALLVYWTTNNILLLLRSVLQKKKVSLKNPLVNFNLNSGWRWGIFAYVIAVVATVTTIPYFGFSDHRIQIIKACTDTIFTILLLGLLTTQMSFSCKTNTFKNAVCICVALFLIIRCFGFWILGLDRYKLTTQFIVLIPILVIFLKITYIKESFSVLNITKSKLTNELEGLFWPATVFLFVLIGIYLPVQIYSSDPLAFDTATSKIIEQLLLTFEAGIILSVLIWLAIRNNKTCTELTALVLSVLAVTALIYTFIVSPDYGVLSSFVLSEPENLYLKNNKYWDIVTIALTLTTLFFVLFLNKTKLLSWMLLSLSFVLVSVSSYSVLTMSTIDESEQHLGNNPTIPGNIQDFLTFSENKKNIVVIMLDMFTGGNIREILEAHPDLRKDFSGFTWYEDSMSGGSFTIFGKPGILGGEEITPVNLNKDKSVTLEEKINFGWAKFLNVLQKENFDISVYDHTWLKPNLLQSKLIEPANLINTRLMWNELPSLWAKKHHLTLNSSTSPVGTLYAISLFRVVPLSMKKRIYQKGAWANTVDTNQNNLNWALDNLSQLDALNSLSTSKITDKNTFKFMINEITHVPWSLNSQCKPSTIGYWDTNKNRGKDGTYPSHVHVEYCALKNISLFIKWLKNNNIYDNTMLFIVSDHGRGDSSKLYRLWNKPYPIHLHSLLMVKPFNQNKDLQIDTQSLTANWDIPVMITNGLDLTNLHPWHNRSRVREHVNGEWPRSRHPANSYNIQVHYKIQGSIFDLKNWKSQPTSK